MAFLTACLPQLTLACALMLKAVTLTVALCARVDEADIVLKAARWLMVENLSLALVE